MLVLVACEFSGVVREAFMKRGHQAYSCDLLDTEIPSPFHFKNDVFAVLALNWDLVIAFPPCTDLCVSGAKHFERKRADGSQQRAIDFFMAIANHSCPKLAIENPIGIMSSVYRKPDQIIQPWQFGHGETKATCLWLRGLPKLTPTNIVSGREPRIHYMPPSADRAKNRSRTYQGIANAFAEQWGNVK